MAMARMAVGVEWRSAAKVEGIGGTEWGIEGVWAGVVIRQQRRVWAVASRPLQAHSESQFHGGETLFSTTHGESHGVPGNWNYIRNQGQYDKKTNIKLINAKLDLQEEILTNIEKGEERLSDDSEVERFSAALDSKE
ncbi:Hypothetical predicted protein [Olea europaea subsp. europaea]|uniref:Uncharacterized protein n=1 Tax=Olea europaea subsp. europaea TaxID=158383 RepID=A0A8S0VGS7_OLEEU|nr:Hypothetical predicted protein [Olea europaea subsp. europaea]